MSTPVLVDPLSVTVDRAADLAVRKLEEKIALLTEFNQLVLESTGACVLVANSEGQVLSINKAGRELLQLASENDVLRRHWTTIFPDLEAKTALSKLKLSRPPCTFHASSRTKNGDKRFWSITFTSLSSASDNDHFLLVARDVTEHVRAERALRESEQAFRKIFEENPIGMVISDLNYRIIKTNQAMGSMLGFSESELLGKDIRAWHLSEIADENSHLKRLLRGEISAYHREITLYMKSGAPIWTDLTTSILRDAENRPSGLLQMLENIQDRKSTEEQVLAYQAQLQSLASEVALSEERQRRRIATDLHDRIGQSLAFARLKLCAADKNSDPLITQLREIIDQAIADTRSLTFELSPPVLYELGLIPGIEWLARKIQEEHGIQTRFHDDGQPKPVDDNFRIVLFQAVRELLVNVVKHARASRVQILLRRESQSLRIIIEDDGIGLEMKKVSAKRETSKTFGLFNIRERVEYLGGRVKIKSEHGAGTQITLIAPLKINHGEQA